MCKPFSGIVERNLTTHWKLGVDSHSNIVELASLKSPERIEKIASKLGLIIPASGRIIVIP